MVTGPHYSEELARIHLERRSGLDIAIITIGAALMFANTLLFIYAVAHHKYPPLRAKNLKLIAVLYLSMLIWYLGTVGTNFNLPGTFSFNNSCIVFGSWLRILCGIFLYIYVHIVRLYIYIRLFNQAKKVTRTVYWVAIGFYVVFVLAYGLPTTILSRQLTVRYIRQLEICQYGVTFSEISFSIVWAGWLVVVVCTYLARNINSSFNEYREMLLICIISSLAIIYLTVVHHVLDNYIIVRWARDTTTFFEYFAGQTPLFILLRVPVYNCIFNRAAYQRQFFRKMHADGMAAVYGCASHPSFTRAMSQSASFTINPVLASDQ